MGFYSIYFLNFGISLWKLPKYIILIMLRRLLRVIIIIVMLFILNADAFSQNIDIQESDSLVRICDILRIESKIKQRIDSVDARVGIAVIINGQDTVIINGEKDFPMMSVFKFPLSLAVIQYIEPMGLDLDEKISVSIDDLKENTYSPMLKKYGRQPLDLTIHELLEWTLKESDNNAADILLKFVGGIQGLNEIMKTLDFPEDIIIGASEDDMHRDPYLCYLNRSTPIAMAELFDRFYSVISEHNIFFKEISSIIENCNTGADRLAAPIISSNATIGHKTGTGDILDGERISAINDCGYIRLANNQHYSIAVFIADSAYSINDTSKIIADISQIIYEELNNKAFD